MDSKRKLFMIGGPNGAGKTTTAFTLMPELVECSEYVNADAIASSLSPFRVEEVAIQSGKLMIQRIRNLIQAEKNFAFEATMSSKGFLNLLKRCRDLGYEVNLLYVWVSDVELAVQRVRHRVLTGGHNIPEEMIRRRYFRSAHNFLNFYQNLADRWMVCDNSSLAPYLLAQKKPDQNEPEIYNTSVWDMFRGLKHEKQRA